MNIRLTETSQIKDFKKSSGSQHLWPRRPLRTMNRSRSALGGSCLLHVVQCSVINSLGFFGTFLYYKAFPCV